MKVNKKEREMSPSGEILRLDLSKLSRRLGKRFARNLVGNLVYFKAKRSIRSENATFSLDLFFTFASDSSSTCFLTFFLFFPLLLNFCFVSSILISST